MLKRCACLFIVFACGGMVGINLAWIKYGIPTHYDGGWHNVALAALLGIGAGARVLKNMDETTVSAIQRGDSTLEK